MAKINFGGVIEEVVTREEFPLDKAREILKDETVAIIGYGVQGPGQALNLRDNGIKVIIGQRKDSKTWDKAIADGWVPGETLFEIEEAAERDRFDHVRVVHLDVGALACVDPHALSFAFEAASNGTRAQGAQLSIRHLPAVGHCDHCSHEGSIDQLYTLCPVCGRDTLKVISGDELRLRDLDVE